ncbi:MAG: hypothetical protein D6718_12080 [Acidobacteria bacterium]|nr:MAG: hypothetical protein D6718_12080 [Acidobacteriota bacterium]
MSGGAEGTLELDHLLRVAVKQDASDLHLKPMRPPLLRLRGKLIPLPGRPLTPTELDRVLRRLLTPKRARLLAERMRVEFGYSLPGVSRFRATLFHQRGTLAASFRRLPAAPPTIDSLHLPDLLRPLAGLAHGLVLIAGPPASGKSSTLAALLREVVDRRLVQVCTIEDPIEHLIADGLGSVIQQEIGADVATAEEALRNAIRDGADVIALDEVRDEPTWSAVVDAAGDRLVIATVRAASLSEAIAAAGAGEDERRRARVAEVLQAVVHQRLVERADGSGMVAAVEVMRRTDDLAALVARGRLEEIVPAIARENGGRGMQTLNQSLVALAVHRVVEPEAARRVSPDAAEFDALLRGVCQRALHPERRRHGVNEESTMPTEAEFARIHRLLDAESRYEKLRRETERQLAQRDAKIRELEEELRTLRQAEAARIRELRHMEADREEILKAVETQNKLYEMEAKQTARRLEQLERELEEMRCRDREQAERIRRIEEERRRAVQAFEELCRRYESKLGGFPADEPTSEMTEDEDDVWGDW